MTPRHCPGHDPDELEMPARRRGALRGPAASQAALDAFERELEGRLAAHQELIGAIARGQHRGSLRLATGGLASLRRGWQRLDAERAYAKSQARRLGRRART